MTYFVVWTPDAFRRLMREWVAAGKPDSGIRAFDFVEATLATDAHIQGESRERERRILLEPPLGVIFEPRPDDREVVILDAWIIQSRRA